MMYSTHNSLSYGKPQKLWQYLFYWTSRCQCVNIRNQYKYGCRFFDFRLVFKNGLAYPAHGIVAYEMNIHEELDFLNVMKDCTISLMLERGDNDREFITFCDVIQKRYPNIRFCGGERKKDYKTIAKLNYTRPALHCCYKVLRGFCFPVPILYAKFKKYRLSEELPNTFDFLTKERTYD